MYLVTVVLLQSQQWRHQSIIGLEVTLEKSCVDDLQSLFLGGDGDDLLYDGLR